MNPLTYDSVPKYTHIVGNILWLAIGAASVLVLIFVLVPFYMTGGNVPSMQPGWFPDMPKEIATIATYQGSFWEHNEVLQDLFWNLGYYGCCFWMPVFLISIFLVQSRWHLFTSQQKRIRGAVLVLAIFVTLLWIPAWLRMFDFAME